MDYVSIEDFTNRLNKLLEDSEQETLTSVLADSIRDYSSAVGVIIALDESNRNLRDENDRLKRANMELYLRVTTTKEKEIDEEIEKEDEKLAFSDLFDEKGQLI